MSEHWEYLAAIIALGAGLWGHVQSFGLWFKGLIITTHWADDVAAATLAGYLANGKKPRTRQGSYSMSTAFVKPLGRSNLVACEWLVGIGTLFWYRGWRPILASKSKESGGMDDYPYSFSYIRGTVDWDAVMHAASAARTHSGTYTSIRYKVNYHHGKSLGSEFSEQGGIIEDKDYRRDWNPANGWRLIHWKPEELGGSASATTFNTLALSDELVALSNEMCFWHESGDWYHKHAIPWRRGYLFHGKPGTGKTSLARAAAETLDLPVHVFDIASMSNQDLRDAWTKMTADAPCIALIEDIDAVFEGRKNVAPGGGMMASGGLTFDTLLNCVDGVERADGVMLIVTTNHLSNVDEALVNRPGRIDQVVEFKDLDFKARLKLAKQILDDDALAQRVAMEQPNMPAARFMEICCRISLNARYASMDPYR